MSADWVAELHTLAAKMLALTAEVAPDIERPASPKLLTFEQAAEALAVGRTTVQELVDRGELPVVSVTGRAVRIDANDVATFIARKRERRG
jgi:excisionase family DNA binding protein